MARLRLGNVLAILLLVAVASASCAPTGPVATGPATTAPAAAGSSGATARSAAPPASMTIFAAASLKGPLDQARTAYEAANPGTTLTISTDSSATLAAQIEQGAPVDVFLSADTTHPRKVIDEGLAAGDAVAFAANELTVIVPTANPAGIRSPADLARDGVKVIAAGDAVPITGYATRLVANLAMEPGYPAGFVAAYAANVVSKEDNVKAVVAKIELDEGDAGIVYATDATASTKIATIAVPDAANVPATYAGVVVKASAHPAAAAAFLAWFAGPDGQAILAGYGFLPPS